MPDVAMSITPLKVPPCVFCRIMRDEPERVIANNRNWMAFMSTGVQHPLIVPRTHVERLEDLDPESFSELNYIILSVMQVTNSIEYKLTLNAGKTAGQTVMHAHFHFWPKVYAGEGQDG